MIAVTGCSGWLGSRIVQRLANDGKAAVSDLDATGQRCLDLCDDGSIAVFAKKAQDAGVTCLIHCAGRAHQGRNSSPEALEKFAHVNFEGTRKLAKAAGRHGIRRFVFISSIKVSGDETHGRPFTGAEQPNPYGAYAVSKWRAEIALKSLAEDSGLEVVIIRPPLLFGPGVKANFRSLVKMVLRGLPIPLGCVTDNRRSIASVENLADMLVGCAPPDTNEIAGRTFVFSDSPPISTSGLIRSIASAAGVEARLIRVPIAWLKGAGRLTGHAETVRRLTGSLEVDGAALREALQWRAPRSLEDELRATVLEIRQSLPVESRRSSRE